MISLLLPGRAPVHIWGVISQQIVLVWKASSAPESHMVRKGEKPRPCCSLVVNPPSWEMPAFLGAVCLRGEDFAPFIPEVLGAASSGSPLYQAQLQGDSSASFSYNSYLKTNKSSRTHKHTGRANRRVEKGAALRNMRLGAAFGHSPLNRS